VLEMSDFDKMLTVYKACKCSSSSNHNS
jgi:hypothetical protein